jgi:putative peptidoglycan lipid II flippase
VETRQKGGIAAAQQLLSSMMLLGCIVLVGVAAILGLLAPLYLPLLGHSFSGAKLDLTRELLYLLLPWIIFSGIANLSSSVLNATEKFALPALIPLLTPLVTIYLVTFYSHLWGIFTLAGGAVIGGLLEAMLLLGLLKKHGMPLRLRWYGLDTHVRCVLAQYVPMLTGAILMGSTAVVDQSMAAMLPSGNVAALSYGNKIIGGILSVGALALSTASLPYFAQMVAARDWAGCRHTLKRYSMLILAVTVPFTLLLIVFSQPLIKLLYQHGAFTAADTQLVSWVQICYAIQIPFFIWSILFVRFITSVRRNDILMYVSGINLALDIVLNLILMRVWHVAGIALSTSIVYVVSFLMTAIWSIRFLAHERSSSLPVAQAEASH